MDLYEIADICVKMSAIGRTFVQAEKFRTDLPSEPCVEINVTEAEMNSLAKRFPDLKDNDIWYLLSGSDFYRKLIDYNGFLLHSSAVCVGGNAYLFSGQSGIGKSTHTSLWQQLFGEKCFILNDDKPAIRFVDDNIFAYGTPWSGKHDISVNTRAPVKALCFIGRGETNKIFRLSESHAAFSILSQSSIIRSNEQCDKLISLIEEFVKKVPVYKLECIPDESAARLSYETMSGEKL